MRDVRSEQGSEVKGRRGTEGQLLSSFTAIMLISPLFFSKPLHVKYKTPMRKSGIFLSILLAAMDAACFDLCTTRGWLTLCKGRRCTEV